MPNYKCVSCDYVFDAPALPDICPNCGASGKFLLIPEECVEAELLEDKIKILESFDLSNGDYLKNVDEIASVSGVTETNVRKVLMSFDDFIMSSDKDKSGEPLFTTKGKFQENAPFMKKFIGAFKNRID